ncbi:Dormancyauxin associated [Cynara cardunculus var. scolymus]|uniref:Dormancyauxin associated n=2 Tax=Cynara cardunculus var. scolymus TaxID=59895 RepID=A0A103XW05_CYNCS|nr:Dormancyauxin associated [Cynara cardunculus var. scolymus]
MGFFRNLWDEALAGPTPDSGIHKLRRYNSLLSPSNNPPTGIPPPDHNTPISRTITILRTNSLSSSASTPSSPAGSSAAGSPFSATSPGVDFKKLTRRKSTADAVNRRGSKSPTGYDW